MSARRLYCHELVAPKEQPGVAAPWVRSMYAPQHGPLPEAKHRPDSALMHLNGRSIAIDDDVQRFRVQEPLEHIAGESRDIVVVTVVGK